MLCHRAFLRACQGLLILDCKLHGLDIINKCPQAFRYPFVLMINELLPYIDIHVYDVEVAQLSRFDHMLGNEIGQI